MAKHVKMSRSDPPRRNELELFMECEEEELTPSQREANYRAHTDYKSALKKIEDAKTVRVPRSGSARKSLTASSVPPMKVKKSEIDDIIVIEDDPVTMSRSPGKRGRPLTKTDALANSAYPNVVLQPSPSFLQTLASTTSNLSLVSSNMSNMPVAPRASSSMIFPSSTPSFLTLPTTLQSNSIGLTMGKKVLLALPVSGAGKQAFMLPTGIKQLQVINAMQSVNSVSGAQSAKVPEPVILVTSGPNLTQATSVSTYQASNATSVVLQDSPKPKSRVGRPRKVLAADDDVQVVEPLQVLQPIKRGRPVKKIKRKLSDSNNAVIDLESPVLPGRTVPAETTMVHSLKPKGRVGRPRKILAPPSDDEVQIVEPVTTQPVKVFKPESKPPAPVASPTVSGTYGLGVKRPITSDEDILSCETVHHKKHRSASVGHKRQIRNTEASEAQTVVSGTYGFGIKRPNVSDEDTKSSESGQKKPRMTSARRKRQSRNADASKPGIRKKQDTAVESEGDKKNISGNEIASEASNTWIPLDEYYYGKKEGDPTYREDKGEYRFKCWYCHKMLYNNLRLMLHMQGHIDNDKQQNLDLSDLTQCKHCYKQFDTPFEMQCHIEKVHQNNSNVLICRICEKDHENQSLLQQHMKSFHQACEMPYSCKLCNYRSSIYSDVVDHFKKRHDSSQYILCLYCLKIFKVSFYKTAGWGMTQNYYQHIQKHQNKGNNKKCVCCKLTFLTKQETDDHRTKDHMPNFRGIQSGSSSKKTVNRDEEQVLVCVPEPLNVKLLNAPATSKVLEIRILHFEGVNRKHLCLECKKPMNTPYHYKNYVECTLCRFATSCNDAFSSHMMFSHSGVESNVKMVSRKEAKMMTEIFCLCGFSTFFGTFMANHLVLCSKRTCYSSQPEMKYFEYDDEQEEFTPFEPYVEESEILRQESSSPDSDLPSLFGVLGLVKKPRKYGQRHSKVSGPRSHPEVTAETVADGIIEDILDSIFPAEKAASEIIACLLDQVDKAVKPRGGRTCKKSQSVTAVLSASMDSIPPELTGARKWKTVKIADSSTPSKKSIFLGSETVLDSVGSDCTENKPVEAEMLSKDVSIDDVPVIESMESEMALLTPRKVGPCVCSEEEGDIFWNMPDIEKMESSADVEDNVALDESEMKDTSWLEAEMDLKQPENTGGVEEVQEAECDEDTEAKSEDEIKTDEDEDSDLLIHSLNKSEDIQLVDGAEDVNSAGNEHIDTDEIDTENGKDVKSYSQLGLNSSVVDLLRDAVVVDSHFTNVEDNEEHKYKIDSKAGVGEENFARGKEISLECSASEGLEVAGACKEDSIGEGSMSANPTDVVSGSLLCTRSEEDDNAKTEVKLVTTCDVDSEDDDLTLGVRNIEEPLPHKIKPENLYFNQELDSEEEDHTADKDNSDKMDDFDQQHDSDVDKKCFAGQEDKNIKPDQDRHDVDQEDLSVDPQEKCDYQDTEQEACNVKQSDHEENRENQHIGRETCNSDEEDHVIENVVYRNTERGDLGTDRHYVDFEQDTTRVMSFGNNDQEHRHDKDVDENACSLEDRNAYVVVDLKNQCTEQETKDIGKEGCIVDNQDNCFVDKDLAFDPCPSVHLQDIILHNDLMLTSNPNKTEYLDFENLFSDTDESNRVVPQLMGKESLGIGLMEKWLDSPNSICLNENDGQLSVKTMKGLQKCNRIEEAFQTQKSDIQDVHSQAKKAQDHSSSAGSVEKRSKGDSSCTDRKDSHSPQTSFPKSPPVSSSDKTNHRDSHHSDSSRHKDRGYGSRDDERRSYNWKDYNRRDSERRDYDRRDYNRADYDRRDSDRRDYDRRDLDRRYYDRNDQGQYDRSASGHRYESHSHLNRRERDDRYERYDSRSEQSRNSGYSKSHDSSNSSRRSHYPH